MFPSHRNLSTMQPPVGLLLYCRVRQLFSVDHQVSVVRGLQSKAAVTDAAAVASLFVLLHDVLQVLFAFAKRQLQRQRRRKLVTS